MNTCRDSGDSYHVDYATDEDGLETENLTHRKSIPADYCDKREWMDCGWVADADGEKVRLLMSLDDESGFEIDQQITAETAEQLSDMFAKAATAARDRIAEAEAKREAQRREDEEIKARQSNLFA